MMMKETSTVISGSWALLPLFPNAFVPRDLDFYTSTFRHRRSSNPVITFLIFHGYHIVSMADANYIFGLRRDSTGIAFVLKLSKQVNREFRSINVIISQTESELQPIFRFHSTVVMNYIAWYGFVCLYPRLTFKRHGLINHINPSPHIISCINKYRIRGFDLQPSLNVWDDTRIHTCGEDPNCPATIRHLLDNSVYFRSFHPNMALQDVTTDQRWVLRVPCYPYQLVL
jgi:hypothetical protein